MNQQSNQKSSQRNPSASTKHHPPREVPDRDAGRQGDGGEDGSPAICRHCARPRDQLMAHRYRHNVNLMNNRPTTSKGNNCSNSSTSRTRYGEQVAPSTSAPSNPNKRSRMRRHDLNFSDKSASSGSRNQNSHIAASAATGLNTNYSKGCGRAPISSSQPLSSDQLQVPDSPSLVRVRTWYTVAKQGVSC